jgi:hypothetical protein
MQRSNSWQNSLVVAHQTRKLLDASKLDPVVTTKVPHQMLMSNPGNVGLLVLLLHGKSEVTIVVDMMAATQLLQAVLLHLGPETGQGTTEETTMAARITKLHPHPQEVLHHHGNKMAQVIQLRMLEGMVVMLLPVIAVVVIRLHLLLASLLPQV